MICARCGTVGDTKRHTKGSFLIELVLWQCFLVPGLIYSIWRLTTRRDVCRACGSDAPIPRNTPVGQAIAQGNRTL